jgi:hypothetical protein
VAALRILLTFTLGFVAMEAPRRRDPSGAGRVRATKQRISSLPAEDFPVSRSLADLLATHATSREFETGLQWLLAGLARESDGADGSSAAGTPSP